MTMNLKPSKGLFAGILFLLAIAILAIVWLNTRTAAKPKWVTAAVDQGPVVQRVTANGTLNPVILVNVGTQISGTVLSLHTDFNRPVKAGQLLAELDPSILQAQIRATQANLSSAKANLNNAKRVLDRNENLVKKGFVSEAALDTLRKDADAAAAQVQQIQAQLSRDETNLSYSQIRSPIDGIVVSRGVDIGQTVAASFQTPTLFQIARDLRRMQIDTSVAEADVGGIKPGQPVQFTVDAFQDQSFPAQVHMVRLNPTTQQNVVTYNVVIEVDNKNGNLLPGMTAQVAITISQKDQVLRVPASALRFRPPETNSAGPPAGPAANGASGGPTGAMAALSARSRAATPRVYTIGAQGELVAKEIKTGLSDGRFIEVVEGLSEGEQVVLRAAASANAATAGGFRFRMF
jgi:HlyD family secretion protein